MTNHELQELEKKALDQLLSGKSLFGKEGAFASMLNSLIKKVLDAEMEDHLTTESCLKGNKRKVRGAINYIGREMGRKTPCSNRHLE